MKNTAQSVSTVVVCVVVAALVSWAGSANGIERGGVPVMAIAAIAAFAINWIVFVPSYLAGTERFYDLTGSATYLTCVGLGLGLGARGEPRTVLLGVLVAIWALRLGTFLFRRVTQDGGDGRFDELKTDPWSFLTTWSLQGLWVVMTLAAALAAMTSRHRQLLDGWAVAGGVIWLVGFLAEVVADAQKRQFRRNPDNDGRFITTGLWRWSRHPNYAGEITLWFGIALIAWPTLQGWQYVTLVSPVFVYLLITRVSGLPMLEARASKRWGDDPVYQAYLEQTPVLFPTRRI